MTEHEPLTQLPVFVPTLPGFRTEEFLTLTEELLAIPLEQDQEQLNAAPFRLDAPEPLPEAPLPPLPTRWYPRPAASVMEAARVALTPPPRPAALMGRGAELERVMRPLLAGHPMQVCGEPGVGKTALLAAIARHERTRQRFRHIWWIDRPDQLDQTLALALNMPHVLAEPDPAARRGWLAGHFDEHTLLIVDNVAADDPVLTRLEALTAHRLVAIDTAPALLDEDGELPADPMDRVTLYVLEEPAAIEALAFYSGIEEPRHVRTQLGRVATALGHHPYALMLAGKLVSRDGLALDALEEALAVDDLLAQEAAHAARPAPDATEEGAASADAEPYDRSISLNRALDVSVAALPRDYERLFEAFGAFPPGGAPFDGLHAAARIGSPLAVRRGLVMLADYGFITRDHRNADHYSMHPVAYARAAADQPHGPEDATGKRMRAWALRYARDHGGDAAALYAGQAALLHALDMTPSDEPDKRADLFEALRSYRREYVPGALADDPGDNGPFDDEMRDEGVRLTQMGLELTDQGVVYAAEDALNRALEMRRQHDSPHGVAEALVALGRLYDSMGKYPRALELLIEAAEMVFNLGAEPSVSVVRRGLARVYRHMGRLHDALGVLDDDVESHLERAFVLREQGDYAAAVREMDQAAGATPYRRAELFLLAGQFAEALDAIADEHDPASAHLRAQIYHVEGAVDKAIQGYHMALDCYPEGDPGRAKTLRGLGAALAAAGRYDEAQERIEQALALLRAESKPDAVRLGRTQRLLAAVHLVTGEYDRAAKIAREAINTLKQAHAPADSADAYRTLGRALWQQREYEDALEAFTGEVEHAQGLAARDERRIGIALHHQADAYRQTGSLDRAVANYRRALTHKHATRDPKGYLVTQLALHRTLVEMDRLSAALDVTQEVLDHLATHTDPDLAQVGYAEAMRARTQQAIQRPIRASQSVLEWAALLAKRADEALADPRPAIRVLVLGLAARSLLAEDRPALALSVAEQELAVAEAHFPDALPLWSAYRDLGEAYMALDQPEEAILTLEPLLVGSLKRYPATYALAHELTAEGYRRIGDTDAALEHLRTAFEHEPESARKGLIQETIAAILLDTGRPAEAVESLQVAVPLFDRKDNAATVARVLTTLARTLGGLNRYAEAIDVYEDALLALRDVEGVSLSHTADVLQSLGQTHEIQGQLPEAARAYRRALNLLERADSPRQNRDMLHLLARVTAAMGDQSAVQLYEQTREETEKWGDAQELGQVLAELANVHRDGGRYMLAMQHYEAALEYQPAQLLPRDRAFTLRNLGRGYALVRRYEDARHAWTEALELSSDVPDESPREIGLTHHAIGEAHRSQDHYADAELSYREALRYFDGDPVAAADSWRALGQTLHAMERYDDAIQALRRALDIEKAQPQQANARLVLTLQLLAAAHEANGTLELAIARYHEVLVYLNQRLQPVAYTNTLRTLGQLYRDDENFAEAHKAFNEALEIETNHVPRSDERISQTLQEIADTHRAQGDLEKAAEVYQKVTAYANLSRRAAEDLQETLDELERRRETLRAAQQSLMLLDRNENAELKDLAFIYALIARSHASLNQFHASAETIRMLLNALVSRQDELDTDDSRPDVRALAWLAAARQAQDENDTLAGQQACAFALEAVRNGDVRWVIEQVTKSLA